MGSEGTRIEGSLVSRTARDMLEDEASFNHPGLHDPIPAPGAYPKKPTLGLICLGQNAVLGAHRRRASSGQLEVRLLCAPLSQSKPNFFDVVHSLPAGQRSKADIDEEVQAMREEWSDRDRSLP